MYFPSTIVLALCAGALLLFPLPARATGIGPSSLEFLDILSGDTAGGSFFISAGNSEQERVFSVSVSGEGARYVKLSSDTFTIPAGLSNSGYGVSIDTTGAPTGEYSAEVKFMGKAPATPVAGEDGAGANVSVSIVSGVVGKVIFSVTNEEIASLAVRTIEFPDIETASPPRALLTLRNLGNVDARLDGLRARFTHTEDAKFVVEDEVMGAEAFGWMPARGGGGDEVEFAKKLNEGEYIVSVEAFFQGVPIFTQDNLHLNVFPEGTLAQSALFVSFGANKNTFKTSELIKFDGVVENNGAAVIQPIFTVEIYKGDELVELLRSESKRLLPGGTLNSSLTWRADENAQYRAVAFYEYGVRETERKTFSLYVGVRPPSDERAGRVGRLFSADSRLVLLVAGLGMIIFSAAGLVVIAVRSVRRRRSAREVQWTAAPK